MKKPKRNSLCLGGAGRLRGLHCQMIGWRLFHWETKMSVSSSLAFWAIHCSTDKNPVSCLGWIHLATSN